MQFSQIDKLENSLILEHTKNVEKLVKSMSNAEFKRMLAEHSALGSANTQAGVQKGRPSLDDLRPDKARVLEAVRKGLGVMPPFADKLSPEQIEAVGR